MPDRSRFDLRRRRRARLAALGGMLAVMAWRQMLRKTNEPAVAAAERQAERPMTAYEPSDWPLGPIAVLYAGIVAFLVVCCFVLIAAYPKVLSDVSRAKRSAPPGPRLQTNPAAELQQFRVEEQKRLKTYYWIDRQHGTVHIPIEQAMKKLVETGIPGFPKAQQ